MEAPKKEKRGIWWHIVPHIPHDTRFCLARAPNWGQIEKNFLFFFVPQNQLVQAHLVVVRYEDQLA